MRISRGGHLAGIRVVHAELPIRPSHSGFPSQEIVSERCGSAATYLGQQWVPPGHGDRLHTHTIEETLIVLAGEGEVQIDEQIVPMSAESTVFIPAGTIHGFRITGTGSLHLMLIFPSNRFAPPHWLD
jgi:mannose-6-phosphate isomerase-like protein (cupin superfamily)